MAALFLGLLAFGCALWLRAGFDGLRGDLCGLCGVFLAAATAALVGGAAATLAAAAGACAAVGTEFGQRAELGGDVLAAHGLAEEFFDAGEALLVALAHEGDG